jgi:cell division protein FtsB
VAVRDMVALVPSGIFLGMVLLAAVAICVTVNLRGRAQVQTAAMQFNQVASELEAIRKSNTELELQVRRITNEPSLIESAARTRLGMVKPTDIVVPIQSQASTNLASLSFVR